MKKNYEKLESGEKTDINLYESLTPEEKDWVEQTIYRIETKIKAVRERSANKIPMCAINGVHDDMSAVEGPAGWTKLFWTNGFWAGIMWQMYHITGDERYAEIARYTEPVLDEYLTELDSHDVGYLWLPTAVLDYKITGNKQALESGIKAANWLAGRFNPGGEYIRAWHKGDETWELIPEEPVPTIGTTIIDCMLNLPLLHWASEVTKDPRYSIIANKHADKTMKYFIRGNGSVIHIVEFDPKDGTYIRDYGGQGSGRGSSWTRGQAWGIYGFTVNYIHSGKKEYLEAAKKIAKYFIDNIPANGLIPSDFCQPSTPWVQDDIGAGAAASGLIELAGQIPEEKETYLKAAVKMLRAIDENSADWSTETDGITLNGTTAYRISRGKNMNYTYADYFYIEAVLKLKGINVRVW